MLVSACGQIDEIREVFDTQPDAVEEAAAAGPTTLPIIALKSRLPMPQSRVVDDHLVYVLDPDLLPPTPEGGGGDGIGSRPEFPATVGTVPRPAFEPGLEAAEPVVTGEVDTTPGPLTHVRVHMAPTANIREIENARATLEAYTGHGAAVGEFTGDDLRGVLSVAYEDRPFARDLPGRRVGTVLALSHRWPVSSPLRDEVVRVSQSGAAVQAVSATPDARIHRASITIEAPDTLRAELDPGPPGAKGFFLHEGQRLMFFDSGGRQIGSALTSAETELPRRLRLVPVDSDVVDIVLTPTPNPDSSSQCRIADQRGIVEVRVCRYSDETAGIELRTAGSSWSPLVGAPKVPARWSDEPPAGTQPPEAGWADARLSPDADTVLAQWGGTCLTEAAAIIDVETAEITFIETTRTRPWGPGTRALGWSTDGRAVVYLGHNGCPDTATRPGLHLVDAEGAIEHTPVDEPGDTTAVNAGTWSYVVP